MKTIGQRVAYGMEDNVAIADIVGLPPGRVKMKRRWKDIVRVFVRSESGISEFALFRIDGVWTAGIQRENRRDTITALE